MKIESKKIIGTLVLLCSALATSSSVFANGYTITPNPNNSYFFGNSAYARNYYQELGDDTYENNPAAACYGLRSCYSLNYLKKTYTPEYYNYNKNSYNNSNYYNQYNSNNSGYSYNNSYNNTNSYYNYSNPVSVYSVPQAYWSNNNNNNYYGNNNYYSYN